MSPPNKRSVKKEVREAIGKQLKDAYQDVVNEPLPASFEKLLSELDEKTHTEDTDESNS